MLRLDVLMSVWLQVWVRSLQPVHCAGSAIEHAVLPRRAAKGAVRAECLSRVCLWAFCSLVSPVGPWRAPRCLTHV